MTATPHHHRRTLVPSLSLALVSACGAYAGPSSTGTVSSTDTNDAGISTQDASDGGACGSPCECAERANTMAVAPSGTAAPDADTLQKAVLAEVNRWRASTGLRALDGDADIEHAALEHAQFLAGNTERTCWPNPHVQSDNPQCTGFTGANIGDRLSRAGYVWGRAAEVIDWDSDAPAIVSHWLWSVYHRQPLLDWRLTRAGFGHAIGPFEGRSATHAVLDLASPLENSTAVASEAPRVFPVPGQTGVPTSFRGDLEGPTPPAPGNGGNGVWPAGVSSGPVLSVHFPNSNFAIADHDLFMVGSNGACPLVPHTFVSRVTDPNLDEVSSGNDVFVYADRPLEAGREYVARVRGTFADGPWSRTWAFRTAE